MKETVLRFNVKHVPEGGLALTGELSADILELTDRETGRCSTPLKYDLLAAMVGQDVWIRGRLDAELELACDRCATSCSRPLDGLEFTHFIEHPAEDIIDLTAALRECILLALPLKTVCRPDCRGLCPGCGQDLNVAVCACAERQSVEASWAELDRLEL